MITDRNEFQTVYESVVKKIKGKINRSVVDDETLRRLFDTTDWEYNRPLSSADLTTGQLPEALSETYLMEMLEAIGIDRDVIIDQPAKKASFGSITISRAPDIGIEPENMRSGKGLLFEVEPIGRNIIKNKDHGVTQAENWFKEIVGLENNYDAVVTNLVHWCYIKKIDNGYGLEIKRFESPAKALEFIHNKYYGLDKIEDDDGYEENIKEFYNDFAECMKKIVLHNDPHSPYQVYDIPPSHVQEKIEYFRTVFFRLLFIKILHAWNILGVNPIDDYVFKTDESEYYGRLKRVFFKVLNVPLDKRLPEVKTRVLNGVPYLNGGLFRPSRIELMYPDIHLSSESLTYIWRILNKYRYIPYTSTSDEESKYITPMALGHIFERTIDVTGGDRKGTGSYYTKKSITNYITTSSIDRYIVDRVNEMIDAHIEEYEKKGLKPIIRRHIKNLDFYYDMNTEASNIISKYILKLLANIKICDNACGSGAFLDSAAERLERIYRKMYRNLGIRELVFYDPTLNARNDPKNGIFMDIYTLRKHIVCNNIYGVDIQEEAVQIAKLRMWLWIINPYDPVSESVTGTIVEPLPNIDYNIMQGNSLIGFVRLPNQLHKVMGFGSIGELKKLMGEIKELKNKYNTSYDSTEAARYRDLIEEKSTKIREILDNIYYEKYQSEKIEFTPKVRRELTPFHWGFEFFDVFENGGFDIVIGNPPYVSNKITSRIEKALFIEIYGQSDDLYNYFLQFSFKILKRGGILGYITSNTYMTIQTKQPLRTLLQSKRIYELRLLNTYAFEGVGIVTNIIIVKNTDESDYEVDVVDARESFDDPVCYRANINIFRNALHNVFFTPNDLNMQIYEKYNGVLVDLYNAWWNCISTSTLIRQNEKILEEYRKSLKAGDVTLIGLITEGGQGMATGNNGRFIGIIKNHKMAKKIETSRPKKLWEFIKECRKNGSSLPSFDQIRSKNDAVEYLSHKTEHEIRELFDGLKERYGRDIFGVGYLYKIIDPSEIADVDSLTEDEKQNGIDPSKPYFVPYDKGDRDGNRWYLETPYYIDWSKPSVKFLKENVGRGKGATRYQNSRFYFREGLCWSDICGDTIKARLKSKSVYDINSMSLFPFDDSLPAWYVVCILNSELISRFKYEFLNNTVSFQINDARQIPIIVPSADQLSIFKSIFDRAFEIKKEQFAGKITKEEAESRLSEVQRDLDEEVYKLYGIER